MLAVYIRSNNSKGPETNKWSPFSRFLACQQLKPRVYTNLEYSISFTPNGRCVVWLQRDMTYINFF